MRDALWIGAGGFFGAMTRYWLGGWVARRMGTAFPYGTLAINVSGSFTLGVIMGLLDGHTFAPVVRLATAIGFIGAYTTFSTFTYETMRLLEDGSALLAGMNVIGSVLAGLVAALLGLATGRGL
jgi:CrcB protein